MHARARSARYALILGCVFAVAALAGLLVTVAAGQEGAGGQKISREDVSTCESCHSSSELTGRRPVSATGLAASPHKDLKCQDCHTAITGVPHTPQMTAEKASCGTCHADQMEAYQKSAHSRPNKVPGDHPRCVTCHSTGDDPHAVRAISKNPRAWKVGLCSHCHAQKDRMSRYRVDPDAVPSYNESFHGKALLRFGNLRVAICTDCHGHHDVLPPNDPRAPTNRLNAAKTCSQAGCHVGAKMNFAMSGANHLRLKLKQSLVLSLELLFFRCLIFGIISGMLVVIFLDLRREVTGPPPPSGRLVALLISSSFFFMAVTLGLATLSLAGALYTWFVSIGSMVLAFAVYYLRRRSRPPRPKEKEYFRLPLVVRLQHIFLMVSFTLLIMTGMPLRFAQMPGVPRIHLLFGGFAGARYTHRIAACVLIATWIWHLLWLFTRWYRAGFSFKAWTMWPNRKDLSDAVAAVRYYLGLSHEEPRYGRFQFREKADYFAEYWGIPVMMITGFILWFPIYWGNRLPEIGVSFAYIAHSYEATLAFLAIVTWHMYNAHFNPSTFPMNRVWLTGTMPREEMEREHPLELARLEAEGAPEAGSGPAADGDPDPEGDMAGV